MTTVQFPMMRRQLLRSLASLADRGYQERAWVAGQFPDFTEYDDLALNIHVLYDDVGVLPDPVNSLGVVLASPDEVEGFVQLEASLGGLIDRLSGRSDADFLADAGWPSVVATAAVALAAMVRGGVD